MTWIREGECCQCGDCCRGDPFKPESSPGMCPLLSATRPNGTRHCTGYNVHPYYLQGCNVWPSIPAHTADLPRCTYTWRWED